MEGLTRAVLQSVVPVPLSSPSQAEPEMHTLSGLWLSPPNSQALWPLPLPPVVSPCLLSSLYIHISILIRSFAVKPPPPPPLFEGEVPVQGKLISITPPPPPHPRGLGAPPPHMHQQGRASKELERALWEGFKGGGASIDGGGGGGGGSSKWRWGGKAEKDEGSWNGN